jgi:hypothetical protein
MSQILRRSFILAPAIFFAVSLTLYLAIGGGRERSDIIGAPEAKIGKAAFQDSDFKTVVRFDIETGLTLGDPNATKRYRIEKAPTTPATGASPQVWQAVSHRNRPVNPDFPENLIRALASATIIDVRALPDGDASVFFLDTRYCLYDSENKIVAELTVGKDLESQAGVFCRIGGDALKDSVCILSGDDFSFANLGLEYIRRTRRDLLETYARQLVDYRGRAADYVETQKRAASDEGREFEFNGLPADILREQPAPGKTEAFAFLETELYDRTIMRVPYDSIRKVTIESKGQTLEATRASSSDSTSVLDWELTFASGFPAAERGELLFELLRNILKRLGDGRGLQASGYADEALVTDNKASGLAAPDWTLTILGSEQQLWTLTIGGPTDALTGDSRAVSSSARENDVFIMAPAVYRSFMYRPDELVR